MVAFVLPFFARRFLPFSLTIFFLFSFSSGFAVPSLASGLTSDNENSPVDYFMRHRTHCRPHQHQQQQQHTPNSTHSSSSIKDELNDEKRGRSISPSISVEGYACSQCSASFPSRDQLEKHEMAHSPVPPVVSVQTFVSWKKQCCNLYLLGAAAQCSRTTLNFDENRPPPKRKCMRCASVCASQNDETIHLKSKKKEMSTWWLCRIRSFFFNLWSSFTTL